MAKRSRRSLNKAKTGERKYIWKKSRKARGVKAKRRSVLIRGWVVGVIVAGFLAAVGYSYLTTEKAMERPKEESRTDHPRAKGKHPDKHSESTFKSRHKVHPTEDRLRRDVKKRELLPSPQKGLKKHSPNPSKQPAAISRPKSGTAIETKLHRDKTLLTHPHRRAKLVIIIDDVHTEAQLSAIRTLPFSVTPSIFPPYRQAQNTGRLARGLRHYMIHLPMESGSAQFNSQTKTIMTSFSESQMRDRVRELRRLFPTAVYINNHTGSIFTSDYRAMKQLYDLLKAEGFLFVDSYTVATSKVEKIVREEGDRYIRRNIFLDNRQETGYIHRQLRQAVKLAKQKGYAVAIGHPHPKTLQALREAKPILKDVDVVYIDELYQTKRE